MLERRGVTWAAGELARTREASLHDAETMRVPDLAENADTVRAAAPDDDDAPTLRITRAAPSPPSRRPDVRSQQAGARS